MALLTLTINNPSPALDKQHQEGGRAEFNYEVEEISNAA